MNDHRAAERTRSHAKVRDKRSEYEVYLLVVVDALQFHLFQVGGGQRHVVVDELRGQRGRPVIF